MAEGQEAAGYFRVLTPTEGTIRCYSAVYPNKRLNEFASEIMVGMIQDEVERQYTNLQGDRENLERPVADRNELLELTNFALNRVHEAAYLIDEGGRFVYVNEESCRSLGYSFAELLQMTVMDIDPGWTIERLTQAWRELREEGAASMETTHRRKDGSILPVEVSASYFEYGGKEYNLSLVRDVTERERTKLALRESEHRYRQIFDNVSDVLSLLEVTPEGRFRILEINPAGEQSLGIPRAGLIGKCVDEVVSKEMSEGLCDRYRQCVQSGVAFYDERTHEFPSGRRHYHSTLIPLRDESGRIHRIVGIGRDITVQKQAESLLITQLELETQLHRLAENTPGFMCRYDRQCRLVYANSGLALMVGRPLIDLLGKTPTEHSPSRRYAQYQTLIETVINTGIEHNFEIMVPDGGSRERYHYIRIIPERGIRDEIVGVLTLGFDITERKETAERLYASEQAFRAVVEHSPDYIARYDLGYRRVYANPALLKLMGPRAGEVLGTTPAELSKFVDASRYMDQLQRVAETGNEVADEVRLLDATGRIRWGHTRIVPEFAPDGKVVSLLAISRDIDELKKSEHLFRTLTENFPDFIARFDRDGRHIYVNPVIAGAFGVSQKAFVGKPPLDMAPTSEVGQNERLRLGIQRAFNEGQPNEDEAHWRTAQGVRIFEVRHIPERDAEGKVVSVLGIARDITKLRNIELALRDSERAFRTLAENAPDPIIRYDRNCRRTYVNPEFERVSGIEAAKLLGETAGRMSGVPAVVARRFRAQLRKILKGGVAAKFELAWSDRGRPQCWYVHAVPECNSDGVVHSVLTVWRDITERKQAERRLRESYELLQELTSRRETAREEERKRIAREMHDELGQHLTALRMGASTLRIRFGHDNPALGEHVQKILELADKTMQVVRDVVASLRPAVLDAGIAAALEWLAAEFSNNGETACRLFVQEENMTLAEDQAVALFRIVQEALTNVRRHAVARHVFIALEQRGCDCLLEVRDDGRGFDPVTVHKKSFGLVGMKERALMLGGEIGIASSPGKGTAIKVRVPTSPAAEKS
ncbi:PAS domain-containing sensor histidine kinase [Paraburkholderia caffeinilytica]|uniref:PAS domain-containing sensor histidine kinase n=2 Tax=Paraburkholderia caffeinilytica TaxID=1761016 RepID=UPI0013BE9020|nr:PAS domain-containing sensor histidine kinase [Paraburkholderia caffeinilytica]